MARRVQISLPLTAGDTKSPIRSVLEGTVQWISNDWSQKARRNWLLTRLFQIRSKEIWQANLTGDTVASNFAPASGWISRHTRAHAGSRSLHHELGPSICTPSALRLTPPQSTIHSAERRAPILPAHLPAPSPPPSAQKWDRTWCGVGGADPATCLRFRLAGLLLRLTRLGGAVFCKWSRCKMSRRAPSRRMRNSRSASSISSCSHEAMVVKSVYCFSSAPFEIHLVFRHLSQKLPVPKSFLFQGAPLRFQCSRPTSQRDRSCHP